jgi:hypothetical protein
VADYSTEITALEAILNAGTSSVSVDGMRVQHDLDSVRKRLAELKAKDDSTVAQGKRRPASATIKLNFY